MTRRIGISAVNYRIFNIPNDDCIYLIIRDNEIYMLSQLSLFQLLIKRFFPEYLVQEKLSLSFIIKFFIYIYTDIV